MTIIHDPEHPLYLDEADVRDELTRVFNLAQSCRGCGHLAAPLALLFELVDGFDDGDAGNLTPDQQDRIVAASLQCPLCCAECPSGASGEWQRHFPRLLVRAEAMRRANRHVAARTRRANRLMGSTGLVGAIASLAPSVANRLVGAEPGSPTRTTLAAVTGVSATRRLPDFAAQRFTAWFRDRPRVDLGAPQGTVTVFADCLVEHQAPQIGKDLVRVYERNGIECAVAESKGCGAVFLHGGDVDRFVRTARRNVALLAAAVRRGDDIVVPQATCAHVLRSEYPAYLDDPDAELVAAHTHDASEYLMKVHEGDERRLETHFDGAVPERITYVAPCHLRARRHDFAGRDLLELTGADVALVRQCAGIHGIWGLRADADEIARPYAEELAARLRESAADAVASDCHLVNTVVAEQTGGHATHPIQILARAYGIPVDED